MGVFDDPEEAAKAAKNGGGSTGKAVVSDVTGTARRALPVNIIIGVGIVGLLTLGMFGVPLPIDGIFRDIGRTVVKGAGNSMTTLGYVLALILIASAVIGNALGRRK